MVNTSHLTTFEENVDIGYAAAAFMCVIFAASAAGMTTGLLSIDTLKLKIKLEVGTEAEKRQARRILPVIANHHFLLCTLLIYNAAATEALPIFLDALVPSWAAVVISVTLVLVFGEIIPTALFTGPNQLAIASWFTGLVYLLQIVLYPVAYPMARLLDCVLGVEEDAEIYTREELSAMLQIIRNNAINVKYFDMGDEDEDEDAEEPLTTNEVNVITGVLSLAKKCIRDVCVPMDKVNMLSSEQVFDDTTIDAIDKCGHSRLPVFRGADTTDILGFFLVKRLISVNPERAVPLSSIPLQQPLVVGASQSLLDVLTVFQSGHSHIALVSEDPEGLRSALTAKHPPSVTAAAIGILTIEDIFEAMLQSEIFDEEDREKGHYQEEASLALREMSLRSTMSMSLPNNFGYDIASQLTAAASAGPLATTASRSYQPPGYSPLLSNFPETEETVPVKASQLSTDASGAVSVPVSSDNNLRGDKFRGPPPSLGDIEQTSVLRRALSEGPGRALRAFSEAVEGRSKRPVYDGSNTSSTNSAATAANERRWINARATNKSVGSALHGGHFSDGSVHAPLLAQISSDGDSVDFGSGIGRVPKGKITPSIITKYVKQRHQKSTARTFSR